MKDWFGTVCSRRKKQSEERYKKETLLFRTEEVGNFSFSWVAVVTWVAVPQSLGGRKLLLDLRKERLGNLGCRSMLTPSIPLHNH